MTEQVEKNNNTAVAEKTTESKPATRGGNFRGASKPGFKGAANGKKPFKKNTRKGGKTLERQKPEFDQKIIDIRRVTRVVKGGRRFSFSVVMVLGNKKGSVGVGIGKASDTSLGIEKAIRDAKKNMIKLNLTESMSIPYEVRAKYCASEVELRPAKGKGVVAGSSVRTILELAGITEVGGKLLTRSKNKLNNSKATIKALSEFKA